MTIIHETVDGYPTGNTREIARRAGAPRGWTRLAPPATDDGEYAILVAGEWRLTDTPPPWARLSVAQAAKRQAIDAEHLTALRRGVPHLDTRWTATDAGRDVLIELIEVAENEGGPVAILDAQGAPHSLTLTELQALRDAGRQYRAAARANRLSLHNQVTAAGTVDDVRAIDETAGWPG